MGGMFGTDGASVVGPEAAGGGPGRARGRRTCPRSSRACGGEEGQLSAAAKEDLLTRKKQDAGFPRHAIEYCLQACRGSLAEVDHIVFYDKPFLKFERLLETSLAFAPRGFTSFSMAIPLWLREKLFQKSL